VRLIENGLTLGAMTNMVKDRPVTAHVFEYTTSFALDADLHFKYPDKGIVPCQIIFCMKEKNVRLCRQTS
jgi:chitin synthase